MRVHADDLKILAATDPSFEFALMNGVDNSGFVRFPIPAQT